VGFPALALAWAFAGQSPAGDCYFRLPGRPAKLHINLAPVCRWERL